MIVTTYNCNSVRTRLDAILRFLQTTAPDVLALQETKTPDETFPLAAFEDAGYHAAFRGEKSYNGVATLTRGEPEAVHFGLGDDDGESETRQVSLRYKGVDIVNTYVPQGRGLDHPMFAHKLEWLRRMRRFLDARFSAKSDVLWVGDLNVAPTDLDVHDPKRIWPHVCFCAEVQEAFAEVCAFGLEDVFRRHLPEGGVYTFWDYRVKGALERGLGWRIDHILATPTLAARSTGVEIDTEARLREKPSDHTFLTAHFRDA